MYALPYLVLPLIAAGVCSGGIGYYAGPLILFVAHPIFDWLIGRSKFEISSQANAFHRNYFNLLCWSFPIIETVLVFLALKFVSAETARLATWELVGLSISLGFVTGTFGITIAHELVHRRARFERGLGVWLLILVNYAHYRVEHVFGHHRYVGLKQDAATARRGESLYEFWIRCLPAMWVSAFRIERERSTSVLRNRMFHYVIASAVINSFVFFAFGPRAWFVFVGQGLVAVLILEAVDYIEHYGLSRREVGPGQYEPVRDFHSWDNDFAFTNFLTFNLGRHAHHHRQASLPYFNLKNSDLAGRHPAGYSAMLLMALFPPLWFRVMDPRVERVQLQTKS